MFRAISEHVTDTEVEGGCMVAVIHDFDKVCAEIGAGIKSVDLKTKSDMPTRLEAFHADFIIKEAYAFTFVLTVV